MLVGNNERTEEKVVIHIVIMQYLLYNRYMSLKFNKQQLDLFEKKANQYNSEEELLVSLQSIKVRNGEWSVVEYDGMRGTVDPLTGAIFVDNFAYSLYRIFIEMIKQRDRKRKYAHKMEVEHHEKLSLLDEAFPDEKF